MLFLLFVLSLAHTVLSSLVVTLPDGAVQGYVRKSPGGTVFYAYQGIPYAKPPLGKLRLQSPQAVEKWSGIKEATKDGNRCYSVQKDTPDESEDCLYVNVFTSILDKSDNSTLLPVMVFIYGGGFRDGASHYNDYGPDYFIEEGVIVVTFNYRLGPFGFLSTEDNVIPGNIGLKDQVFALKWVQENIYYFGGDKSKVTIFGQSAGGASVGFHILSKQSAGLFRGGIAESGSAVSVWAYLKNSVPYGYELATKINPQANILNTSQQLLDYLRMVTAKDIDIASTQTTVIDHPLPVLEPEHDDAFLTESMYVSLQRGNFNKVPLLIGANSEEYIYLAEDEDSLKQRMERYDNKITKLVSSSFNIEDKEELLIVGQEIKDIYLTSDARWQDNLGYSIAYLSEEHFYNPVIKHAELQSNYTDVYLYQFSYSGVMGNNEVNVDLEGAEKCRHGEELYYLFKRKHNDYDNSDLSKFSDADVLTHKRMIKLWTNFAKYLNPTPDAEDPLLQNLQWPKVTPGAVQHVDIGTNLTIETDLKNGRYLKWTKTFDTYAVEPHITF